MKVFTFFLPQFHEIPENDEWWGKGFTEWTNVKAAKPLFKGHLQPKVPLNNNYYNLLDKETVEWQTKLMEKFGVDGQIYYHYYFQGKLLLEKPAENLLKWKNIKQNFFFCWANHSWYRSWEGSQEILMDLKYGNKSDWEEHFQYLLPFFKDERYEKKDNMPLFMLFKSDFSEKNDMLNYFNRRCKEEGFDGIYIILTCNSPEVYNSLLHESCSYPKRLFIRQPDMAVNLFDKHQHYYFRRIHKLKSVLNRKIHTNFHKPVIYNGNKIYEIMDKFENKDENIIHGAFFEWDNTPRHKNRGYIIKPVDYKHFKSFIDNRRDDDFLFINAWNEWCEGMILEPTEETKYKYLEWIYSAKNCIDKK